MARGFVITERASGFCIFKENNNEQVGEKVPLKSTAQIGNLHQAPNLRIGNNPQSQI